MDAENIYAAPKADLQNPKMDLPEKELASRSARFFGAVIDCYNKSSVKIPDFDIGKE